MRAWIKRATAYVLSFTMLLSLMVFPASATAPEVALGFVNEGLNNNGRYVVNVTLSSKTNENFDMYSGEIYIHFDKDVLILKSAASNKLIADKEEENEDSGDTETFSMGFTAPDISAANNDGYFALTFTDSNSKNHTITSGQTIAKLYFAKADDDVEKVKSALSFAAPSGKSNIIGYWSSQNENYTVDSSATLDVEITNGVNPTLNTVTLSGSGVTVKGGNTEATSLTATASSAKGTDITKSVTWSVSPSDQGVTINTATGAINVGAKAKADSYTVTATPDGSSVLGEAKTATLTVAHETASLWGLNRTGNGTVDVPTDDTPVTITYTAVDQYDTNFTGGLIWSIVKDMNDESPVTVDGISINNGVVTITKDAAKAITTGSQKSFYARASLTEGNGSTHGRFTIQRSAAAASAVTVSGGSTELTIPYGTQETATSQAFTAAVADQYGVALDAGASVSWTITPAVEGVSIADTGIVTVTKDAAAGIKTNQEFTVTATVGSVTGEATNKVTVKRADAVLTTIGIAKEDSTSAITATENLTIPANAQAADKTQKYVVVGFDQYGDYKETLTSGYEWMFTPTTDGRVTFSEGTVTVKNGATANGTFTLKATTTDDAQKTAEITIKVVDIVVTWPAITVKKENPVYGDHWGDILEFAGSGSANVDGSPVYGSFSIVYGARGAASAATAATVPNAGTQAYDIVFKSDDGNYTVYKNADTSVNVAKKELAVSWTNTKLTYNGSEQKPTATAVGAVNGETVALTVSGGETNATTEAATATAVLGTVTGGNASADNYVLKAAGTGVTDGASTSFTIAKKSVTVSGITASGKVYDGDTTATVNATTATFAGKVGSDELTITATGAFADKNVGASKTVNLTLGALGGTSAANYVLASTGNQATTTAAITAKPVTVSSGITASDKVYDGNTTATVNTTAAEFTGKVGSDELTITATGAFADENVGTGKTVNLTLGALGGADAANYQLASSGNQTTATADITAKALTVGAGEGFTVTKEYDGKVPTNGGAAWKVTGALALTGVVSGDTVTTTDTVTASGNEDKGYGTYTVSVTGYSLSGADAGNYTVSNSSFSFAGATITKPTMTLTASISGWTYGVTANDPDVDISKGPEKGGDGTTVTYAYKVKDAADSTYSATVPTNAGNYTVRATVTNNNWENGVATADFTIAKAALTVTAKPKTITYGDAPANDGVEYSGFVKEESASVLGGTLTYTYGDYVVGSNVGSYTITPSGLTSDNYTITFATGTLTVRQKEVGVTWSSDKAFTYNGTEQAPAAVVSGLASTDTSADVKVTVSGQQSAANLDPTGTVLAGKEATYTATASALTGNKAANYKLPESAPATTFTIKQATATVSGVRATWDKENKRAAISYANASVSGIAAADTNLVQINTSVATGEVENKTSGTGRAVTVTITLTDKGSGSGQYQNYAVVLAAPLTVDIPIENVETASAAASVPATNSLEDGTTTDDATALATILKDGGDSAAVVVTENPSSTGIGDAAVSVASDVSVINEAQKTAALDAVKTLAGKENVEASDIIIVVKPVIDIAIKAVAKESEEIKSFKLDIKPMYELVATTTGVSTGALNNTNSVALENTKAALEVTEPVELEIPIPAALYNSTTHKAFVKHTHDGKAYQYEATTRDNNGKYYAKFTAPHGFSEFELTLETAPFVIGDVPYETLNAAVAAVKNGETITVKKEMAAAVPVTVSRPVSFTVAEASSGYYKGTITAAAGYENTESTASNATGTYTFVATLSATAVGIPSGTVSTAISAVQISVSGGTSPYTYSKKSGPEWLSVDAAGKVTGTRPASATDAATLTITVADAVGAQVEVAITVGAVTAAQQNNNNTGSTGTGSSANTTNGTTAKISTSVSGTTATVTVKDSDLAAAAKAGSASAPIVIDVSKAGKTIDTVSLPAGFAAKVSALETAGGLEVALTTGELTFNDKALDAIAAAGSGSISLSLEKQSESSLAAAQKTALAGMTVSGVYDLSLKVTGKAVESFNGGTATVSVPFTPAAGTKGSDYAVLYVSDTGATERMATSYLNGELTFTTGHFSTYVVVYDPAQFSDVVAGSFYEAAVKWAVGKGITTGTSATTFSPDAPCTRAQAVTFLYRAAGEPEVTLGTSFTDVKAGSYYEKAVAWAVANGITTGVSADKFAPDADCTRAQIVTFLARYEKAAAVSSDRFTDVAADAYYAGAVGWAVANGITNGTSATQFSPEATCTRAQIVTFLYRDFVK